MKLKQKIINILQWSEKYTRTDMIYLTKGGFWLSLGQIISAASRFLLAIAFANLLPKETFGTYKYVLSFAGILTISTLSGMNTAVVRTIAQGFEGCFIPALKTKLRWGVLGTLASLGIAGYYFLNNNIYLTICFLIVAVFLPLMSSFAIYQAFWQGRKRFDIQTKYYIIGQITATGILILTLFLSKNLLLILLAYFVPYTLLRFIFLQISIKKLHLSPQRQDPQTISYGKHLSLVGVIGSIAGHLDKILIWHFLGAGSLAIYAFAILPPLVIKDVLKSIAGLALPKFSQRSKEELKAHLPKKILRISLLAIFIIILYALLTTPIYKIFFPQYLDSITYSRVFIILLAPILPTMLLTTFFLAQMKKKEVYIYKIFYPLIQIISLLILLPFYGIWGAILAILIARFSTLTLLLFLFKRT